MSFSFLHPFLKFLTISTENSDKNAINVLNYYERIFKIGKLFHISFRSVLFSMKTQPPENFSQTCKHAAWIAFHIACSPPIPRNLEENAFVVQREVSGRDIYNFSVITTQPP